MKSMTVASTFFRRRILAGAVLARPRETIRTYFALVPINEDSGAVCGTLSKGNIK
jgi:hypothetical protein